MTIPIFCPGCLYSGPSHLKGCGFVFRFPLGYMDAILNDHEGERKKHLSYIEFVNQNARGK